MTEMTFQGAGVYPHMTNEEYHGLNAVGSSGIKDALYTAHTYNKNYGNPEPEKEGKEASWALLGSALHALVLEPQAFDERYIALPDDAPQKPTDAMRNAANPSPNSVARMQWWDEFARRAAGKTILTADQMAAVQKGQQVILAHAIGRGIMVEGQAEISYFAHDPETGTMLKSRPDWTIETGEIDPEGNRLVDMVDLKSTGKGYLLTVDRWKRQCLSMGYHTQLAHHGDVMELALQASGEKVRVGSRMHLVYSFEDQLCRVFSFPAPLVDIGRRKAQEGIARIAHGLATGEWPGFPEDVAELPVNTWDGAELEG